MSRMMDNLARVLGGGKDADAQCRPDLKLVGGGVVPTPDLKKRGSVKKTSVAVALAALSGLVITLTALKFRAEWIPYRQTESQPAGVAPAAAAELIKTGQFSDAERMLSAYLSAHPESRATRINLGFVLRSLNRMPEAEALYRKVLESNSMDPVALNNLGVILAVSGAYSRAIAAFESALKAHPGYGDARLNLARTMERANRIDDAVAHYRLYIDSPEASPAALLGLKDRLRKLISVSAGRKPLEEKF